MADTTTTLKRARDDAGEHPAEAEATGKRMMIFDIRDMTSGLQKSMNKALTQPEVFAKTRQALCESLPNYRAYNSSLYTQNGVARGFYMDGAARPHDQFTAQVIISSVGGGRVLDEVTKKMTRISDMKETNTAYKAICKAHADRSLLPVIAGLKHPLWPVSPPHNFNVLDYFWVTDVWAELNVVETVGPLEEEPKTIRVFCFRLEKANLQKHSWWDHNPASYVRGDAVTKATCAFCKKESKQILDACWTCLNHNCATGFFKDSDGKKIIQLTYSKAFLEERSEFIGPIPSLKPTVTSAELNGIDLFGSEPMYRAGIVCEACGSCTSRVFWNRWSCEYCRKEVRTEMVAYPRELVKSEMHTFQKTVARLRKTNRIADNQMATKLDTTAVKHCDTALGAYQVSQFLLPDPQGNIIGSVTVFRAGDMIRERGPDIMFDALSTADIGLRRNTVSGGHSRTQGLSRHFQQNWGAKYKFAVDVQSKGFEEAPDTILQAVQQLKWAGTSAVPMAAHFITQVGCDAADVPAANVDFNECLSLGYMTDDRINYHDDGEKQCGPTVATLSLGSPAMMAFRPKKKSGMTQVVSPATCPKAVGREYADVLAFPLYHGDLLVMNGTLIHRYYEHKVEPSGGRRFALTCRYMDPTRMATDEERRSAVIKGSLPAHADKFIYQGDGYLTPQQVDDAVTENAIQGDTGMESIGQQGTAVPNTHNAMESTGQHDTAVPNTHNAMVQDTGVENDSAENDAAQIDAVTENTAQEDTGLEEQTTIDRYHLRARKSRVTYKE